ncbi:hypothetical protein BH20ACT20_BH20ACT20_01640 [soil metagenome]|nr:hypothetical protein [Thermoleophilaceae bacterium]MDQ3435534.1 hypothetical protein [Actinomycetota bacterium]
MPESKLPHVKQSVTRLPRNTDRDRRMFRTVQARRRLTSPRGGGRAWINGREVGGSDPRYAHLAGSYD